MAAASTTAATGRRQLAFRSYDEDLADRIRELLAAERGVSERKMFGGLGFMIGGNMAIAASGQGDILARTDPEQSDKLVATTNATEAVMRGPPLSADSGL